ncbi:YhfH family protein [Virgibacillus sediminis]|uniref:YhfH family protein n=1 Tax=Virgibacillus sediminis TaxID=202260 RepID=A0ABV7A2F6_9BACI
MDSTKEAVQCPECGTGIQPESYTLVCDYCLSKKED